MQEYLKYPNRVQFFVPVTFKFDDNMKVTEYYPCENKKDALNHWHSFHERDDNESILYQFIETLKHQVYGSYEFNLSYIETIGILEEIEIHNPIEVYTRVETL